MQIIMTGERTRGKSFFGNLTASRSTGRLPDTIDAARATKERSGSEGPVKSSTFPYLRKAHGSTPELSFYPKMEKGTGSENTSTGMSELRYSYHPVIPDAPVSLLEASAALQ